MVHSFIKRFAVFSAVAITAFGISACSGVSPEQMEELNALKTSTNQLEVKIEALTQEKSSLEATIAELNKKLAECAKMRQETENNLKKLPK